MQRRVAYHSIWNRLTYLFSICNKARYGSGSDQATEFATFDEKSNIQRGLNLANSSSVDPVEDVSEDFDKMKRGQDVITESQKVEKLQKRLTEQETELEIVKREPTPSEYPVVRTLRHWT